MAGGDEWIDASAEPAAIPERFEPLVEREGGAPARSGERQALNVWLFRPQQEPVSIPLDQAPALAAVDDNFLWVNLTGYSEAELQAVAQAFELHEHTVHAVRSPWQRPSLVIYPGHFFVSVTIARANPAEQRLQAGELDLVVGPTVLVSAHKQPLPFADRLRARALANPDLVQFDSAYMLYMVLDELVAYYEGLHQSLQVTIEEMEERALHDSSDEFLAQLLHFKRYAFALSHLVDQHRDVFSAFLRPDFRWVTGTDVEVYFRDLQFRFARLRDALDQAQSAANGAFDIYVSHLSQRTNEVIRVLTIVSTLLFSATVIIGLFGTSLATTVRGSLVSGPLGFALMLITMLAVTTITVALFRRNGWI